MKHQSERRLSLSSGLSLPCLECLPELPSSTPPILLLHGLSDDAHSYEPMLRTLPPESHAVALTQRGHGDADRPADGYSVEQLARDAVDALDQLGIDQAVIVGHSMGAHVAAMVAARHPARAAGLVLLCGFDSLSESPELSREIDALIETVPDPMDPAWAREFQASTLTGEVESAFFESVVRASSKVPPRVWRAAWAGMRDVDLRSALAVIHCPALLVWGSEDGFVSREMQEQLLTHLPEARLHIEAGVGHGVHWERPESVAAVVAEFANSCRFNRLSTAVKVQRKKLGGKFLGNSPMKVPAVLATAGNRLPLPKEIP